jgi:hypothetical protein
MTEGDGIKVTHRGWPPENPQTDEDKKKLLAYVLRTFNFKDE